MYSLSEVGTTGSFTSASVVISFVLGIALMVGFVVHALHIKNPLLELRLFKDRTFTIANICIFVLGATLFGSMFLLRCTTRLPVASRPGWPGCSWRPRALVPHASCAGPGV